MIHNHKSYTDTFRQLAMRHKKILHSDTEMHFARIVLSRTPIFGRDELSEFVNSRRNQLKYPALLLISYHVDYGANHHDSLVKPLNGEFIILEPVVDGKYDQLDEVLDNTETIGEDLIATLANYYEDHPEDGLFMWEEAMNEKLAKVGNEKLAGTKFYFSVRVPANNQLTHNPDNFIEL
jgi:hypothetical protein